MTPSSKEIWFLTGSQHLYGPEVLDQVTANSRTISDALDASDDVPVRVVAKPVLTEGPAIRRALIDAEADDACIGVIAWMHTFSPGQDVDHRARPPPQAAAAPAHAGQPGAAVGRDRHGLHESQPGRPRRPGVRVRSDPARHRPQDRHGTRGGPRGGSPRRRLGARRPGPHRDVDHAAGPLRRQHAQRRGDRRRQGRGGAPLRGLGQHLGRQRPGRRRRRRRRRRRSTSSSPSTTTPTTSLPSCSPTATGTTRCATAPASSWGCASSSPTAASRRSPPTSRTSAGCASCPVWPCSG